MLTRRAILAAPAILTLAAPALAKAPLAGTATPFVYRYKLGSFEVTAIADGVLPLGAELFPEARKNPKAAQGLLAASGFAPGPVPTFINTYVVNTGDKLVLIDTGFGVDKSMGPDAGLLPKNLAAAGIDPAAIDAVLLTHLHPDHANGLAPGGTAAFANAEIVVTEPEHKFWTDDGIASRAPKEAQPFFAAAKAQIAPYAARTRLVSKGEVLPGISVELAPGHTPGHAAYRIASGGQQLLVWGDIVHVAALQFDQPGWSLAFDTDMGLAAATRKRLFDMAATDAIPVAGMHLTFPGIGRVVKRGKAYAFVPQRWQG